MATTTSYFSLVKTGNSTWTAVHVNQNDVETSEVRSSEAEPTAIFAETTVARSAFAERFPRLTIAMISLGLFAVSLTAEVEWLRQAGYYWR